MRTLVLLGLFLLIVVGFGCIGAEKSESVSSPTSGGEGQSQGLGGAPSEESGGLPTGSEESQSQGQEIASGSVSSEGQQLSQEDITKVSQAVMAGKTVVCTGRGEVSNVSTGEQLVYFEYSIYISKDKERFVYNKLFDKMSNYSVTSPYTVYVKTPQGVYVNVKEGRAGSISYGQNGQRCDWMLFASKEESQVGYDVSVDEEVDLNENVTSTKAVVNGLSYEYTYYCYIYSGPDPFQIEGTICSFQNIYSQGYG